MVVCLCVYDGGGLVGPRSLLCSIFSVCLCYATPLSSKKLEEVWVGSVVCAGRCSEFCAGSLCGVG